MNGEKELQQQDVVFPAVITTLLQQRSDLKLARGAFGEIFLSVVQKEQTSTPLHSHRRCRTVSFAAVKSIQAVERVKLSTGDSAGAGGLRIKEHVHREISALQTLQGHPHIIRLLAVFPGTDALLKSSASGMVNLVFEYHPIDLYTALYEVRRKQLKPLLSIPLIRRLSSDIAGAVHHCHSHGIIHRDITPANVLLSTRGHAILCDFGLAKPLPDTTVQSSLHPPSASETTTPMSHASDGPITKGMCALNYRPPELLLGGKADSPSVDIYSLGVLIAELVLSHYLYGGKTILDQIARVFDLLGTPSSRHWPEAKDLPDYGKLTLKGNEREQPQISQWVPRAVESPHLEDLLQNMICLDPQKRIKSTQLVEHTWIATGKKATEAELVQELIPPALVAPFLHSGMDEECLEKAATSLVSTRKRFLAQGYSWK